MAEWHHQCNGLELGQTPGDSEGQRAWCAAGHGVAKSQTTGRLNSSNWKYQAINHAEAIHPHPICPLL